MSQRKISFVQNIDSLTVVDTVDNLHSLIASCREKQTPLANLD